MSPAVGESWTDGEEVVKILDVTYERAGDGRPLFGMIYCKAVSGVREGTTRSVWKPEFVRRFKPVPCRNVRPEQSLECQRNYGHLGAHYARSCDEMATHGVSWNEKSTDPYAGLTWIKPEWRNAVKPFRFMLLGGGAGGGAGYEHYADQGAQKMLNADFILKLAGARDERVPLSFLCKVTEEQRLAYYGLTPERPQAVFDTEDRWNDPDYRASYCGLKK